MGNFFRTVYEIVKIFSKVLLILFISFGFWYLIGWFISSEYNPMDWPTGGKIMYLMISMLTVKGGIDDMM